MGVRGRGRVRLRLRVSVRVRVPFGQLFRSVRWIGIHYVDMHEHIWLHVCTRRPVPLDQTSQVRMLGLGFMVSVSVRVKVKVRVRVRVSVTT